MMMCEDGLLGDGGPQRLSLGIINAAKRRVPVMIMGS